MSERPSGGGGGSRLSPQTLIVASLASLTAAIVTSTFWQKGTPITAAVTPVIVALASELYSRPARRISQFGTRTRSPQAHILQRERVAVGAPPRRPVERPPITEPTAAGPIRIYRSEAAQRRRRVSLRVAIVTAAIAFLIAVAALTLPELVFGGSVASSGNTTFFGGGGKHKSSQPQHRNSTTTQPSTSNRKTTPAPQQTTTQPAPPAQTTPQTTSPNATPPPGGTSTPQSTGPAQPAPAP